MTSYEKEGKVALWMLLVGLILTIVIVIVRVHPQEQKRARERSKSALREAARNTTHGVLDALSERWRGEK